MGANLHALQLEEAELLANIIAHRLTRAALEILKICGVLEDRPTEPDPDQNPEEAEVISMAEALLRRHTRR